MCCDIAKEAGRLPRLREERQATRQAERGTSAQGVLGAGNETGSRGVELIHGRYSDDFVIMVKLSEAVLNPIASQAHSIASAHVAKLRLGAVHIHAEGYSNASSGGHTNQIERV